jgi:imidazoleglycerol phosphate dehydratase HisB
MSGISGSPFTALVPGAEGLNRDPVEPVGLRRRMAALWGVTPDEVLPAPGWLAAVQWIGDALDLEVEHIEFALDLVDPAKLTGSVGRAYIFSLDYLFGLAGAPCAGIISDRRVIERLSLGRDWKALPTPTVRLAEAALDPSRIPAIGARAQLVRSEARRLTAALPGARVEGRCLVIPDASLALFERYGVEASWDNATTARVQIGPPEQNDLVLAAMGVAVAPRPPARRAEVVRDTKETRIVCSVDLDARAPVRISTGVGFYDHMLEQVARHGGFSLILSCAGDLHIEAHHTIEDCALALGDALRQGLGDRAGVARFGFDGPGPSTIGRVDGPSSPAGKSPSTASGDPPSPAGEEIRFVAPLDEAVASVVLDLSGRPLCKFSGIFARPMIGAFPTEMTPHVFRSIADALRATIHVSVTGEDDHHKIEACFKAFGRALRMAIAREGGGIPSTKGVLA